MRSSYDDIIQKIQRVEKQPQSIEREEQLIALEWDRDILIAKRSIKVLTRAKVLLDAYHKTGSMTVIYPNGQTVTDRPARADHPVQFIWNLKYKALDMADASIPYD